MTLKEALQRIEALERKVRELEMRPAQQYHSHYHYLQPHYQQPHYLPLYPPQYPYITYSGSATAGGSLTLTNGVAQ